VKLNRNKKENFTYFLSFVENKDVFKIEDGHFGRVELGWQERIIGMEDGMKVRYVHVWKYHIECITLYN
jgi:hypothetical protein